MQSCSREDDFAENEITNSPELEEYIIAAIDLQEALKTFEREFAKVDFENLETVIENGQKVRYLPAAIRSLNIERKVMFMNEQKEALLNKYPQLLNLEPHDFANYVNNCIKQSTRVSEFFLDKKINIYQPLLKAVTRESSFDNMSQLIGHLYNWTLAPDYVEASVLFFNDGTFLVVVDDRNTPTHFALTITIIGDKYYFNNKRISEIAHTHLSGFSPSSLDLEIKMDFPYCSWSIFYNGAFHSY
jgi:hypothetical protein